MRSPLPTVQLLRCSDLAAARDEWRQAHDSSLPGALQLLLDNKQRLRELGTTQHIKRRPCGFHLHGLALQL